MNKNSLGRKSVKFILMIAALYAVGCWLFWPSASFESSDAGWGDHEIPLKNRDFESMVLFFELYKLKCNARNTVLYRTTDMQYWNVFSWPSYLMEKKWLVPYKDASFKILGGIYPDATIEHCYNGPETESTLGEALRRSEEYIKNLGSE